MLRIGSYAFIAAALVVASPAVARDLTAVTYGGLTEKANDEAYYKPYTAQTGKAVIMDQDPGLAKIRAMVQSGNITWDLIDQESAEVIIGCDEGLFEKYDPARFQLNGIPENLLLPCGVPMYVAGNIMVYDADRITENPPKSWADFWDVTTWPGKRGIWNTPKGALEIAMMADGVAPADIYTELQKPGGVDRAFAKLDELKPHLLVWNTGADSVNRLASGEYIMTFAWNARIQGANEANQRNFKIVWEAGFTTVTDYWVTPLGTPNLDQVYEFLSHFTQPERQAEFMKISAYSAVNPGAYALLPPERLQHLPLSPDNAKYSAPVDDTFWANNLDSLTERFNAWLAQ